MARIDDSTIHNPFGWRLADLADPSTGATRRRELRDQLLVCEAEEVAHGYRHLTIVHGDPADLATSRRLSDFYDTMRRLASGCAWVRIRGDIDYVTVTVRGPDAERLLAAFTDAAHLTNPGTWLIAASAVPPSI